MAINDVIMSKNTIRRLLNAALIAFGAVAMITGVIKFVGLHGFFSELLVYFPARFLNTAHDWSGTAAVILAAVAVFAYWRAAKSAGKPVASPKTLFRLEPRYWWLIGLALLVVVMTALNFRQRPLPSSEIKRLAATEIRDYKGEKLSSIADLQENSIKGPQHVDINSYKLGITGLVNTPRQLTYDQVLGFAKYEKVMDLHCVEGWSVRLLWEGVLVRDLLADAGVKPEAKVVILHAVDGYTSALPLDYFMNNDILLGYKMNGLPLLPERGFPFQLVAESKWGYKWVKWVNEIELSDDVNYRGTWEKAGYSNNGDYSGPMFER